ncbi:MAG: hypothetical protein L0332_33065 [Chloroflexi bacterium]|nr:hypothetical protein [Chloroflexota bacterium]
MSDDKALAPVEQREVEFYGDEVTAVLVDVAGRRQVFVPVRPICDFLGVSWTGQRRRINRDPVLSDMLTPVNVTFTGHEHGYEQTVAMMCLPLDYIAGFLFGLNADRVKREFRERVILYQRECYRVLSEAFQEGRLTSTPTLDELLQTDSPAVRAYKTALAIVDLARNQVLMEARLDDYGRRLETIEAQLSAPGRAITEEQASQLSQAIKAVALVLGKKSGRNEYGGVYGELYRKFGITGYKLLPARRFQEAMDWLGEWYKTITGRDIPF